MGLRDTTALGSTMEAPQDVDTRGWQWRVGRYAFVITVSLVAGYGAVIIAS